MFPPAIWPELFPLTLTVLKLALFPVVIGVGVTALLGLRNERIFPNESVNEAMPTTTTTTTKIGKIHLLFLHERMNESNLVGGCSFFAFEFRFFTKLKLLTTSNPHPSRRRAAWFQNGAASP